jgi:hypothetical protein
MSRRKLHGCQQRLDATNEPAKRRSLAETLLADPAIQVPIGLCARVDRPGSLVLA